MSDKRIVIDVNECTYGYIGDGQDNHEFIYPLIILKNTGIWYTAQSGGMACRHPEAEGFSIPFHPDSKTGIYKKVDDCTNFCWGIGWEVDDEENLIRRNDLASKIQDSFLEIDNIKFDYDRIDELLEGWWPVRYKFVYSNSYCVKKRDYVTDAEWMPGILVTGNCD